MSILNRPATTFAAILALALAVAGGSASAASARAHAAPLLHDGGKRPQAPHLVPKRLRHLLPAGRAHSRGRGQARAAWLDPTGRVDSTAYCNSLGGLQQLTGSGGISTGSTTWSASTGNPARVVPTIAGDQLIAFQVTASFTDGTVKWSHWYWAIAQAPLGYFREDYSYSAGMAYSFTDATTGQISRNVGFNITPATGTGVRYTMRVAWYRNGVVSNTLTVGVPWVNGNVGAYCWN